MSKDTARSDSAAIAAWLRKEAAQVRGLAVAAADPYGQRLSFETADKLERAAEIVELSEASAPDRTRHAAKEKALA